MTIEKLARAAQQKFLDIRKEFTTVHNEIANVREEVAAIRAEMVTKEELLQTEDRILDAIGGLHEEFEHVYSWLKELDGRVGFLEKKAV